MVPRGFPWFPSPRFGTRWRGRGPEITIGKVKFHSVDAILHIYIYTHLYCFWYSYTVHMKYAHCRYDIYIYMYIHAYCALMRWSTLVCCDMQIDAYFLNWPAFTVEETAWTFGVEHVLFVGPVSRPTTPSWLQRSPQRQSCVQDVWWETSSCSVTAMCQYNLVPHFIVPSRWTLARVLSSALEEMWIVFFTSRWLGQISGFSWEQWLEHGTYGWWYVQGVEGVEGIEGIGIGICFL